MPGRRPPVVHVVAKTHLDLGFTALASEVVEQYLADFFPRAIDVAEALATDGDDRLVWTTGSWILHAALHDSDQERARRVAAAVEAGHLAWHALPLTLHTELADAPLLRSGLAISGGLDARFGRRTTAAKMTDVPGHTRSLVPLLAEAGITFLHLGVNPAWPVPDVPQAYRWRAPDGSEITVIHQEGGYGGEVAVPGCDDVLVLLHAGDNLGPPSVEEVRAAHAELRLRHPGAEVRASTLDAFARALDAAEVASALPVVTSEIGDPWLFGVGSDPVKVSVLRRTLAQRRRLGADLDPAAVGDADRLLLLSVEHTWGLDQKVVLGEDRRWGRSGLAAIRGEASGARFEASWAEQRAYVDAAVERLRAAGIGPQDLPSTAELVEEVCSRPSGAPDGSGWRAVPVGEPVLVGGWELEVGPDGGLQRATAVASGWALADDDHRLGVVTYQGFDEADYERFYAQLRPAPEDEWWARWDNTKPGIDACGAVHGSWHPEVVAAWAARDELLVELAFAGLLSEQLGAPPTVWASWRPDAEGHRLELELWWPDKPASRLPEAIWCSFRPSVDAGGRWSIDKLGQQVDPTDVVARAGRSLHAVGEGIVHEAPAGRTVLQTLDAPLVAPGRPNLLDADPPVPDLDGGWHVLLADNCWGTNFPMWIEGPARFGLVLDRQPG